MNPFSLLWGWLGLYTSCIGYIPSVLVFGPPPKKDHKRRQQHQQCYVGDDLNELPHGFPSSIKANKKANVSSRLFRLCFVLRQLVSQRSSSGFTSIHKVLQNRTN